MATFNLKFTLKHCCKTNAQIHQVHAQAITTGIFSFYPHSLLSHILQSFTATIENSPKNASSIIYTTKIFKHFPNPVTFNYNSIIRAHTLLCSPHTALIFFHEMRRMSIAPDSHTYYFLLNACGLMQESLSLAKALHAHVTKFGILDDVYVHTTLSCTYGRSGDVDAMKGLFDGSLFRNAVTYSTMLDGFCKAGQVDRASELFDEMPSSLRDVVFYTTMIDGFAKSGQIEHAVELFDEMPRSKRNVLSYNVMIDGFLKAGKIDHARKLFDEMPSSLRDVRTYTTMIDEFFKAGLIEHAVDLFDEMPRSKRNELSYNVMINRFVMAGKIDRAKELFDEMPSSLRNVVNYTSMIDGFAKAGLIEHAVDLFDEMPSSKRDELSYNVMIDGFIKAGKIDRARELFDEMPSSLRDVVNYTTMINGFFKAGQIDHARELLDKMPERDTVSWNTLLAGYIDLNPCIESIALFHSMMDLEMQIDGVALTSLLRAYTQLGKLAKGKEIHGYLVRNGIELDAHVGRALVDLYAKWGCIEMAKEVFRSCPDKNVAVWNAMLMALAIHGLGGSVLRIFSRMLEDDGVKPNGVTILAVLVGCNHSGLINDATRIFLEMESAYGVPREIKHYGCMVDLLARAGLIKEAREMIEGMPMEADAFVWGALLGGCKKHVDVDGAEEAAKQIMQLEPDDGAVYSSLTHIYASLGRWEDVVKMRRLRNCFGINKRAGFCTIELGGITHKFFPGDRSHPGTKEIYLMLNDLQLHKSELVKNS